MAQFLVCTWAIYTVDSYLRLVSLPTCRAAGQRDDTKKPIHSSHRISQLLTERTEANVRQLDYPGFENGEIIKSQMVRCKHHGERKGSRAKSAVFGLGDVTPGHGPTPRETITLGYRQRSHQGNLKIRGRADREVSNDGRTSILR